jgi:ABC-type sugar transport system substrate-binding protein
MLRRRRGRAAVAGGLLVVAVAISGCGSSGGQASAAGSPSTGSSGSGSGPSVYLLQNVVYPYISANNQGVFAEAKKVGVKVNYANANGDTEQQLSQVRTAIASGAKGIIIQPNDSVAVDNVVSQATQKGICVVALTVPIGPKQAEVYPGTKGYVGWNELNSGALAADAIAKQIGGKGDVAVMIGSLTNGASKARMQGAEAEWKAKWPGIKVVSFQQEQYNNETARADALALVQRLGSSLKGLFVETNPGADAAAKAIATTPLRAKVAIASVGGWSQFNADVKNGTATADIPEAPVSEGRLAVDLVDQCIKGNKKPVQELETELPAVAALKSADYTLTVSNLSAFKPEW